MGPRSGSSRRVTAGVAFAALVVVVAACGEPAATGTSAAVSSSTTTSTAVPSTTPTTAAPETSTSTVAAPDREGLPVVMDTDMAAEGTMSILYLLGKPEIDVRAITVSGTGLVHCEAGVRQALGLIALAGAEEIPVACGPEQPLDGFNAFPTSWRVWADDLYGIELPEGGTPSGLPAPELLVSVIQESPEPVVVYADGPMTNLAAALRLEPAITGDIAAVYAMGGAVGVPGNTIKNPDAEWNVWVDPVAAAEVLTSGVPITLVPLDATNQLPLNVFHLRALQAHQTNEVAAVVAEMLAGNEQLKSGGLYFWDQLTAALVVDESLATFDAMDLEVVVEGPRDTAGAIVVAADGTPVSVAVAVEVERFEREFLGAIAGEPIGTIARDADIAVAFDGEAWSIDAPEGLPAGEAVLSFTNASGGDAAVAFGWLTGEATEEDLEAWPSIEQPPFLELDGLGFAPSGGEVVVVVPFGEPGIHYVAGLDVATGEKAVIARIEVGG